MPALTCYTLAKKMEVHQPNHMHCGQGSSDVYWDRYRRYPTPRGRVATFAKEELFPPDPEPLDPGVPKLDVLEGLSLENNPGHEPLPKGRTSVFCVWGDQSLCSGLPA